MWIVSSVIVWLLWINDVLLHHVIYMNIKQKTENLMEKIYFSPRTEVRKTSIRASILAGSVKTGGADVTGKPFDFDDEDDSGNGTAPVRMRNAGNSLD